MHTKSVLAEIRDSEKGLKPLEKDIYEFILENWPTFPLEIAEHFKENLETREERTKISTKYTYYLKKMIDKGLLMSKKSGNALIVWPVLVERYRIIHDILEKGL